MSVTSVPPIPQLRRPRPFRLEAFLPQAVVEPVAPEPEPQPLRPVPVVQQGTRGIYDPDERVRAATARAMVRSRQTVPISCAWSECVDPATGLPRVFRSRLIDGKPERRACSANHRLKLWRQDMRERGYHQITVGGRTGWLTPEGDFYPYPSSRPRVRTRRRKRSRATPVAPEA